MLKKIIRRIRIALIQTRVNMLGDLEQELSAAGLDTHRLRRIRVVLARELAGLRAQALQERVRRSSSMFHVDQRAA